MPIQFPNTKYRYYDPSPNGECDHPSGIKVVRTICQNVQRADHSYTIAEVDDNGTKRYAIRWNIANLQYNSPACQSGENVCLGFPYSHSYPTWFILPEGTVIDEKGNLKIQLQEKVKLATVVKYYIYSVLNKLFRNKHLQKKVDKYARKIREVNYTEQVKIDLNSKRKNILIIGRLSEWDSLAKHTDFFLNAANYETTDVYLYLEGSDKLFQIDSNRNLSEKAVCPISALDASNFDMLIYTSPLTHNCLTSLDWRNNAYIQYAFPKCGAKLNFAYSVWDGTVCPPKWVEIINTFFDAVFVPMDHLADAMISSGVKKTVFKLLNSFDYSTFLKDKHHPVNTPFVFGWNGTLEDRKNVFKVVSAFIKAFGNDSSVRLHLHTRYNVTTKDDEKYIQFIKLISSYKNIVFDNSCLSVADNINLMKSYDAYVYPSMAEGYSVTPREALAAGHALILSDIKTHQTITDLGAQDGVFWVKANKPVPIHQLEQDLGVMYDIDEEELSNAMSDLYNSRADLYTTDKIEKRKKSAEAYDAENASAYFKTVLNTTNVQKANENKIGKDMIFTNDEILFCKWRKII